MSVLFVTREARDTVEAEKGTVLLVDTGVCIGVCAASERKDCDRRIRRDRSNKQGEQKEKWKEGTKRGDRSNKGEQKEKWKEGTNGYIVSILEQERMILHINTSNKQWTHDIMIY